MSKPKPDPYALLKWVLRELAKKDKAAQEKWENDPQREAEVRVFTGEQRKGK